MNPTKPVVNVCPGIKVIPNFFPNLDELVERATGLFTTSFRGASFIRPYPMEFPDQTTLLEDYFGKMGKVFPLLICERGNSLGEHVDSPSSPYVPNNRLMTLIVKLTEDGGATNFYHQEGKTHLFGKNPFVPKVDLLWSPSNDANTGILFNQRRIHGRGKMPQNDEGNRIMYVARFELLEYELGDLKPLVYPQVVLNNN